MGGQKAVVFKTENTESEEVLIRQYILSAMERLENSGVCDGVGFARYGYGTNNGMVKLFLRGDVSAIVEDECDRWEELVTDGLVVDWELTDDPLMTDRFGEQGAELADRIKLLASRMSAEYYSEFDTDERPAPVSTFPNEDGLPVGEWGLLHFLLNQQGYGPDEEIDVCTAAIRNRLFHLGAMKGMPYVEERIAELVADLEAMPEEIEQVVNQQE